MDNTLIVTGAGPTKEAALQDARAKLGGAEARSCSFTTDYDAVTKTHHVVLLAVLAEAVPAAAVLAEARASLGQRVRSWFGGEE
jgi:hypothetical protein